MKTEYPIRVRVFPVTIRDERTGETTQDTVALTKEQLRSFPLVGMSATELIYNLYNRKGYRVQEIGKPKKQTIRLDLEELTKEVAVNV